MTDWTGLIPIVIGFIGISLNGIVIGLFVRRRQSRKRTSNWFMVHQSIVDAVHCGMYVIPRGALWVVEESSELAYTIVLGLLSISATSSLLTFSLVIAERYTAIAKPAIHEQRFTKPLIKRAMELLWVVSIMIGVIIGILEYFTEAFLIIMVCGQLLVGFVVLVLTGLICLSFWKSWRTMQHYKTIKQDFLHARDTKLAQREFRYILIYMIIFLVFLVTFLPTLASATSSITFVVYSLASLVDPIITLTLKEDFTIRHPARTTIKVKQFSTHSIQKEDVDEIELKELSEINNSRTHIVR